MPEIAIKGIYHDGKIIPQEDIPFKEYWWAQYSTLGSNGCQTPVLYIKKNVGTPAKNLPR